MKIGFATGLDNGDIVIGRDARSTGRLFSSAVSSALLSVGANVCDLGILTTPTLAYATRDRDCGLIITASHNPPEYNGIKLWNPDGSSFGTEQMRALESRMEGDIAPAQWNEVGTFSEYEDAISDHSERILSLIGKAEIKVVVDCANGPAALITPAVLEEMGCEVIAINSTLDGRFPGRPGEPTEENLSVLKKTVVESEADLGIAHDGDADRMVAVDDTGRYAGGDVLLKLFAKETGAKSMVAPIDASMVLEDQFGEKLYRTKVGDIYVSERIREEHADFGGEPSGTWVFPDVSLCPDGIFAAAKLVEICADRRLSEIIDGIPTLPMLKETIFYPAKEKQKIISCLNTEFSSFDEKDIDATDGYRVNLMNGWGLIRLSGTEPKIRIIAEAREMNQAKEIMTRMKEIAVRCIG